MPFFGVHFRRDWVLVVTTKCQCRRIDIREAGNPCIAAQTFHDAMSDF